MVPKYSIKKNTKNKDSVGGEIKSNQQNKMSNS